MDPLRVCITCRKKLPRSTFIRVMRTPDGRVAVEGKERIIGRSVYLCKTAYCISRAVKGERLAKVLKVPVPLVVRRDIEQMGGVCLQNENAGIRAGERV